MSQICLDIYIHRKLFESKNDQICEVEVKNLNIYSGCDVCICKTVKQTNKKTNVKAELLVIEVIVACMTLSSLQYCVSNMHLAFLDKSCWV